MKDAVGGSLLLNLVVIFTSIVILFFAGIIAYSKAYKIKNRIIEVIEKHETYNTDKVEPELDADLKKAGYIVATQQQVASKCEDGNLNESEYLYCVYEVDKSSEGTTYEVVTYIHFDFPVIGNMLTFAVKGQTKVLGKDYNY